MEVVQMASKNPRWLNVSLIYCESLGWIRPDCNSNTVAETGKELQMVYMFAIKIFWLEILDCLSKSSINLQLVQAKFSHHLHSDQNLHNSGINGK